MMTQEQFSALARSLLLAATTYAAGKGWISASVAGDLVAFGVTVLAAGYTFYKTSKGQLINTVVSKQENDVTVRQALIDAVAANPAVFGVLTTEKIARDTVSTKVVSDPVQLPGATLK